MIHKNKDTFIEIKIFVKPGKKKTQFIGIKENKFYFSIHAKPKDGEANNALIAYLSYFFHLPKTKITLKNGEKSRYKTISLPLNSTVCEFLKQHAYILP